MLGRHRFASSVLALAILSTAAPALAEPSPQERAEELKRQGDAAMDALRYDEAIDAYTRAYAASPDPALLYNRGRVHQARGEWPEALADLDKFARDASPELRARVPKLDELLAEVRSHVSALVLNANVSGARVLVRDKQVGTTPLAGPLQLVAGAARVEVLADGYFDWRRDVDLKGASTTVLDVQLAPRATSGVLRVRAATAGARVFVDDKPIGGAPAEAIVRAGMHRVVVHADGYDDKETSVVVATGDTKDVDLEPDKRPGLTSQWWFWTGVGVIVVGAAVTSVALLTERSPDSGDHFQPGQVSGPLMHW
jgi:hypothetical protein